MSGDVVEQTRVPPPPSAGEGGPRVSEGRERGAPPYADTSRCPSPGPLRGPPSPAEGGGQRRAQPFRAETGGLIDRTPLVNFTFDGRSLTGHPGDTLASALLANGVRLVGRSFKYHRPRGILSAGPEEPNALVELREGARREPNTRATVAELYDGLVARSQNRWPSLALDALAVNALAAPVLAAGFYYKTFMWPAAFWERVYEPLIRRAAGLGRAAGAPDPDTYETVHAHCDVLVIGAGPAGLSAALAAGRAGARVVLADEDFLPGGRLLAERAEIDGRPAAEWLAATLAELASLPEIRILPRTTVYGIYDHGSYGAVERVSDHLVAPPPHTPRQRAWRITARRAVLAAGAIERPHVFGGNDRPGVMLAGAVRTYLNRYGVLPGQRLALFATSDDGWRTATDVAAAGGAVAAVIDARPEVAPALRAAAERAGAEVMLGAQVVGTQGHLALKGVDAIDARGRARFIACDCLAMANGWNPAIHLASHLGRRPIWDPAIHAFVADGASAGMTTAGACAGHLTLAQALADGTREGAQAADDCGFATRADAIPTTALESKAHVPLWRVAASKGKAFVDFQNDVTAADIELAHREGFRAVEHLKRYTTLGMATDQGKTALAGLGIMAQLTGQPIERAGTTMFRPPYTPVSLGALAGARRGTDFKPTRLTPTHGWAAARSAVFVEAGPWLRAAYFPKAGEADWLESVTREVTAVRAGVGICDVSTLGKIDVQGPDAARFLDRVYANAFLKLPVGRARYGVMLREDGFVMDDGTTARLSEHHFVMTTTTANAGAVMQHLEYCAQWLWPGLAVALTSVTEQFAQIAVAGPRSRKTLRGVVDPAFDLVDAAFPYMAAAAVTVGGGIPARLFRLSFSGERAYELAVPAAYGEAAMEALMRAGEPFGIVPYGTEALGIMRIEKGHAAGPELDGRTTAGDLGLGRMLSDRKDYIGRLMKDRPGLADPDRPALAGFRPVDRGQRLRAGAHFLALGASPSPEADEGHMSSVAYSPSLGHWIGLGLIRRGPERHGERVRAYDPVRDGDIEVEIVPPCHLDPDGERLRG